jgi:hypothetical protein
MSFRLSFSSSTSPRLRILHLLQTGIAGLTLLAALLTFVIPSKHRAFTFGLLYTPLLTSITTVFIIAREQKRAQEGTLSKQKYVKYQLCKMAGAFGMSIIGFIAYVASSPSEGDKRFPGDQGLWLNGVKIDRWQGMILWLSFFNWYVSSAFICGTVLMMDYRVFLWAGLFYSCCMTGNKQGPIALEGEEAQIGLNQETGNDESIARDLQAQDGNWQP